MGQRGLTGRALAVALAGVFLMGCRRPPARGQLLPFLPTVERIREQVRQPGVFYTVYVLHLAPMEHGLVDELWQYLDEEVPEGASAELRRQNNLRVGLLKERRRAAAEGVLKRIHSHRLQDFPTFSPAGRTYYYDCGRPRQTAAVFYWTDEDSVTADGYVGVSLWLGVEAAPVSKGVATFIITPALGFGERDRQPIHPLATVVRCPVGCSVVVGAVDPQPGSGRAFLDLGNFFQATVEAAEAREQVLILTVDAVVPDEKR